MIVRESKSEKEFEEWGQREVREKEKSEGEREREKGNEKEEREKESVPC